MSEEELIQLAKTILSTYFTDPIKVTRLSMGNANANYVVVCNDTKYFFRIYLPVKDFPRKESDIKKEIEITNWFNDQGFPVAKAIPNLNNEKVVYSNGYYGALFNYLEGGHVYGKLQNIHFEKVGELMASVHKKVEENKLVCDKQWEQGNFWLRLSEKVEKNKNILQTKDILLSKSLESKNELLNTIPQYLIHGDFHFGNLLFDENNNISGLLDFDDYRMGHFMDDLVRSFVCELVYTPKDSYNITKDFVVSFFKGYQSIRTLNKDDLDLINTYIDLHYLSALIAVTKRTPYKVEEYKKDINLLREFISNVCSKRI